MIKRKYTLNDLKAPGIGRSAAWLGLAYLGLGLGCGEELRPRPEEPIAIEREDCDDNPYLSFCPPIPDPEEPGEPPVLPPALEEELDDLPKAQAQNVLLSNCGGCHGTQLTEQAAEAGMNYINDMDKLAANQKIVPLNADASPIIIRMRNGTMPPQGPRVTEADIEIVANYINNPLYWPVPVVKCDNDPVTFDQLYEAVARDLQGEEADDQPFLRYISLANRVTAGVCTNTTMDVERQGLTKMLNMLSIRAQIEVPLPVDKEQTLFRIDLRDFDWDRPISVNGQDFDDVWEAIVEANTYAVAFVGDDADDAREDAQTDVPVMFLDTMVDVATFGNLYYAIIGVDVTQTLDAFILEDLEIDIEANLENEDLIRAGTTRSRISRQDRLIERHEIEARSGVFYQSFDFADDGGNDSIFQDPFGFSEGEREAIFTLPNGMLAYLTADGDGNLLEESDILLDTSQNNFRALTGVSCGGCHITGFIPVVDEVRDVVVSNARALIAGGTLDQEQLELLTEVYLPPEAFARTVEEDSISFYRNALQRADLPLRGADPVSSIFTRFDRDMELADAAGDLGASADELDDQIQRLDPRLGILRAEEGTIDRDDFTAVYVASLCIMSGVLANQPEEAACLEAEAALLED